MTGPCLAHERTEPPKGLPKAALSLQPQWGMLECMLDVGHSATTAVVDLARRLHSALHWDPPTRLDTHELGCPTWAMHP